MDRHRHHPQQRRGQHHHHPVHPGQMRQKLGMAGKRKTLRRPSAPSCGSVPCRSPRLAPICTRATARSITSITPAAFSGAGWPGRAGRRKHAAEPAADAHGHHSRLSGAGDLWIRLRRQMARITDPEQRQRARPEPAAPPVPIPGRPRTDRHRSAQSAQVMACGSWLQSAALPDKYLPARPKPDWSTESCTSSRLGISFSAGPRRHSIRNTRQPPRVTAVEDSPASSSRQSAREIARQLGLRQRSPDQAIGRKTLAERVKIVAGVDLARAPSQQRRHRQAPETRRNRPRVAPVASASPAFALASDRSPPDHPAPPVPRPAPAPDCAPLSPHRVSMRSTASNPARRRAPPKGHWNFAAPVPRNLRHRAAAAANDRPSATPPCVQRPPPGSRFPTAAPASATIGHAVGQGPVDLRYPKSKLSARIYPG